MVVFCRRCDSSRLLLRLLHSATWSVHDAFKGRFLLLSQSDRLLPHRHGCLPRRPDSLFDMSAFFYPIVERSQPPLLLSPRFSCLRGSLRPPPLPPDPSTVSAALAKVLPKIFFFCFYMIRAVLSRNSTFSCLYSPVPMTLPTRDAFHGPIFVSEPHSALLVSSFSRSPLLYILLELPPPFLFFSLASSPFSCTFPPQMAVPPLSILVSSLLTAGALAAPTSFPRPLQSEIRPSGFEVYFFFSCLALCRTSHSALLITWFFHFCAPPWVVAAT